MHAIMMIILVFDKKKMTRWTLNYTKSTPNISNIDAGLN